MGNRGKKPAREAAPPDPARAVGRVVGLGAGVTVGAAAATTGLVAGVPAPDLVLRAVCAGVLLKIVVGWGGALVARSFMRKPDAARPARQEAER